MAVQLISFINNYLGLSGDSKPTDVPVGSTFYETDTTDTYVFNGSAWSAIPGTGASIGGPVSGSTAGSILYVDSSNQLAEDNTNLSYDDSGKFITIGTGIKWGDGDTELYESSDDVLKIKTGGTDRFFFSGQSFVSENANGSCLLNVIATDTAPTLCPRRTDQNTGVGSAAADQYSAIAGGKEGHRITETTAGNDSLQHTVNGLLGQTTGDEVAYSFNYTTNKAAGSDTGLQINMTDTASPGSSRLFDVQVGGDSKFSINTDGDITFGGNSPSISPSSSNRTLLIHGGGFNAADVAVQMAQGNWSNTTGSSSAVAIVPTYNQSSGDGANTDLLVNRTETAVGSGEQNLLDLQVDSTSKFRVDNLGSFTGSERSADPGDPAEGKYVMWMSDGTGTGDDGDIMIKITAGASTKTITLVDFSAF